jgi:hypothetical protein
MAILIPNSTKKYVNTSNWIHELGFGYVDMVNENKISEADQFTSYMWNSWNCQIPQVEWKDDAQGIKLTKRVLGCLIDFVCCFGFVLSWCTWWSLLTYMQQITLQSWHNIINGIKKELIKVKDSCSIFGVWILIGLKRYQATHLH